MFPRLTPFRYSDQEAADLAAAMENPSPDPPGIDRGTADDSPTLPAEYTYLGQFIDHNLDFDATAQPTGDVSPASLTNLESFRFDLDNLFGGGPTVDPQLYAADRKHLLVADNRGAFDLARDPLTGQAILVEPRDDENQILSQVTAAFAGFYNDFVDRGDAYATARRLTEEYYQEIVLTDVLPAFVGRSTIRRYLKVAMGGRMSVSTPNFPSAGFTPIEFSVGAYRFGHSLVRQSYHINDIFPGRRHIEENVPIFDLAHFQAGDLSGGSRLPAPDGSGTTTCTSHSLCVVANPAGHRILWRYFVPALDFRRNDPSINFARRTQPTISPALYDLPAEAIPGCADAADPVCNGSNVLLARDFARGKWDGLASGQDIARALGCPVLSAPSLNPTHDAVFDSGTPLLYYVLAEAKAAHAVLGCVGGRIVAQTFLRALWETPNSILHTHFHPARRLVKLAREAPAFSFGDLLVDTGLAPLPRPPRPPAPRA
jgi:hypothetical protein